MQKLISVILLCWLACQISAMAQLYPPAWLTQIKLSGLSGPIDRRLAIINDKTFSSGEELNVKLAGKSLKVKCLEIRDQSVLIQIQDLASPYVVMMSGEILAKAPNLAAQSVSQQVHNVDPPVPTPVQPTSPVPLSESTRVSQPIISANSNPFYTILFFAGILLALLVGIAIGSRSGRYQHRKNIGEAILADIINRQFNRPHLLLNNVTLPTAGGTTQIDHVLVADTGIFVIETKHYTGWIFGNPQERQWTQSIYQKKSRFQNPLHQNYGHIKTLQSIFDLPEDQFHSVVVFTGNAEFKTNLGPNVIQLTSLIPFLTETRPTVFDERKMAYVVGRIEMKRERRSLETDEYHLSHVRDLIAGKIAKEKYRSTSPPISQRPAFRSSPLVNPDSPYMPKT
jgi:hypothetical protein